MALRFLKSRLGLSRSIDDALARHFDRKNMVCYGRKFSVIIPSFPGGCPGSRDPCQPKQMSADRQRELCRNEAKEMRDAMESAFGEGNTRVKTVGGWRDPSGRWHNERGVKIETRYDKSCLTKDKSAALVDVIDKSMKRLCQYSWFVETEEGVRIVKTGNP